MPHVRTSPTRGARIESTMGRVVAGCALIAALTGPLGAQQSTLTGRLHHVWDAEATSDNPDGVAAYVVDDAGRGTRIVPAAPSDRSQQYSFDRRRVEVQTEVIRQGPTNSPSVRVRSLRVIGVVPSPIASLHGTTGLDFITVLCRFADDPTPLLSPSQMERVVGPTYPGMRQYFGELSSSPDVMAGNQVTTVWFDLPQPRSYYVQGTQTAIGTLATDCTTAADAEVYFPAFAGINLQFSSGLATRATAPYDVLSFGGSWTLTLDQQTRDWGMTWMSVEHAENYVVYAHEMGHALGWPHSSGRYGNEYDSAWDVMSRGYLRYELPWGWLTVHTIGAYKDAMGWIPANRRWTPAAGSVTSNTLVRGALAPAQGHLLAIIPSGPNRFYTAETRMVAGHDGTLPGPAVVLHEVDYGRAYVTDSDRNGDPNDAGAMWTPGETFTDSIAGLSVRVDAETQDGFAVTITRGWRLDVNVTGEGTVRSAVAGDIDCDAGTCSHLFPTRGTGVQLTAEPLPGWSLAEWTGACAGRSDCTLTMGDTRTVRAEFRRQLLASAVLERLLGQSLHFAADQLAFIDGLGNGNGEFDVGDVRAWLLDPDAAALQGSLAAFAAPLDPRRIS
ncbi:MAG: hypothetical protein ABL963_04560 [Longimicrobiales bacterium]